MDGSQHDAMYFLEHILGTAMDHVENVPSLFKVQEQILTTVRKVFYLRVTSFGMIEYAIQRISTGGGVCAH